MIIFKPSKSIEKETSIDFEIFSFVVSKIFEVNFKRDFNYNIKVHKSRMPDTSYVYLEEETNMQQPFTIMLAQTPGNLYENIKSIIHEFRHIMQHSYFKCEVSVDFDNFTQYYNCQAERDARRCERLAPAVLKAYRGMLKSKEIFSRYQLGTFL